MCVNRTMTRKCLCGGRDTQGHNPINNTLSPAHTPTHNSLVVVDVVCFQVSKTVLLSRGLAENYRTCQNKTFKWPFDAFDQDMHSTFVIVPHFVLPWHISWPLLHPGLARLEWLSLDHNLLASVPGPALLPLASLNGLDLHQNPWNCSCGLKPLVTVTTNMLDIDNTKDGFCSGWGGSQCLSPSPPCAQV